VNMDYSYENTKTVLGELCGEIVSMDVEDKPTSFRFTQKRLDELREKYGVDKVTTMQYFTGWSTYYQMFSSGYKYVDFVLQDNGKWARLETSRVNK